MDKPNSEMLIYFVIAGIVLFNYLRPLITRWLKQQQDKPHTPQQHDLTVADLDREVQSSAATHSLPAATSGRQRKTAAVSIALPHRNAARRYLANRSKLRQAIITATVLGPCHAQQPPDRQE